MDRRQARSAIRRRAVDLGNCVVRSVLTARSDSFTWDVSRSCVRYCSLAEPTPSLYSAVSDSNNENSSGSVRRLRDLAPYSCAGLVPCREQWFFPLHQELLAVKPVEGPLTLMTLASFSRHQIIQTLSDLRGEEIISLDFRTTFLQYLQLCRKIGLRFKVAITSDLTQCLSCLQYGEVPFSHFKCDCIPIKFRYLQDCNCECGFSLICCRCDELPQMCYDLDVLFDIVTAIRARFESLFHTDAPFMESAMRDIVFVCECPGVRDLEGSPTNRLSQFEPP